MEKVLIRVITILYRRSQIYLTAELAKYNITSAEYPFIIAAMKHSGSTQDEMAGHICVDKSAAARSIRSLEEKGYVRREQDETNRRQNKVYITEAGKALWPKIQKVLSSLNEFLAQGMDAGSLELLYNGLIHMEENIIALTGNKELKRRGGDECENSK